ncbi:hypothetical protein LXL04_023531 [Taraxacum kok-saghyz]
MSSRRSGRFTRVSSEEGGNHIGANPTELGGVFGVPVVPPVGRRHRGQGFTTNVVTREELANEIARAIQDTLPNTTTQARDAILNVNDDNMGGGEDEQEYSMPDPNPSVDQPVRANNNHERWGCSSKTFMTCKPPLFDGEPNPIKSTRWITEIEGTFDTSKCADLRMRPSIGGVW